MRPSTSPATSRPRRRSGRPTCTDQTFEPEFNLDAADLYRPTTPRSSTTSGSGTRPPTPSGATFQSLQKVRNFYELNDVDVDRYTIDGGPTQVIISARELDTAGVTQDSWEAEHLTFTHGYGAVVARPDQRQGRGRPPVVPLSDVPRIDEGPEEMALDQPGLYFGEGLERLRHHRHQAPARSTTRTPTAHEVPTEYSGEDGVNVGSFFRRAAFALRFGDLNPLFSGNITGASSKVLLQRDVVDRVRVAGPVPATSTRDPYPVVIDGHGSSWILDAYTTSARYPYAERAIGPAASTARGLDQRFNYVRNSVKAVVDAYDGSVTLYIVDDPRPDHPGLRRGVPVDCSRPTSRRPSCGRTSATPRTCSGSDEHVGPCTTWSDPDAFYTQEDAWVVARDPGRARQNHGVGRGDDDRPRRPRLGALPSRAASSRTTC